MRNRSVAFKEIDANRKCVIEESIITPHKHLASNSYLIPEAVLVGFWGLRGCGTPFDSNANVRFCTSDIIHDLLL